jgi:hypothetical protein
MTHVEVTDDEWFHKPIQNRCTLTRGTVGPQMTPPEGPRGFHPELFQVPLVLGAGPGAALEQRALALAAANRQDVTHDCAPGSHGYLNKADRMERAQDLRAAVTVSLLRGDTYVVAPEITDVLFGAAPGVPADADLQADTVPADAGFCYFAKSLSLVKGTVGPIRALSWCVIYQDEDLSWMPVTGDTRVGGNASWVRLIFWLERFGKIAPITQLSWQLGNPLTVMLDRVSDQHEDRDPRAEKLRVSYAFFAFIQQRLVEFTQGEADRASRRRAEAIAPQVNANAIHVIRLRRIEHRSQDGPATHVDWSCRWIVSGHWRRQPCGLARADRRLLWVHSHIKGPENKPMKAPAARVFAVIR